MSHILHKVFCSAFSACAAAIALAVGSSPARADGLKQRWEYGELRFTKSALNDIQKVAFWNSSETTAAAIGSTADEIETQLFEKLSKRKLSDIEVARQGGLGALLNYLGGNGWELVVSHTAENGDRILIFKRPMAQQSPAAD